jgi:adenine-specific DNA-methyltransferase
VPFSTFAKVVRGIATGANDYFTFNLSKARQYAIDERYLLPCVCKAVDVRGHFFTRTDFENLMQNGKKAFLLNAQDANDPHVKKYLKKGENEQIDKKYLTACRNPWFTLEKRPPSPIWVSVFNRTGLRFVRNEANVSNLTTFHCIYPRQQLFSSVPTDLLFAYLLTDTARRIFEDNSREYGNGLQKFEPNDLNKGQMLDLSVLSRQGKTKILRLYQQYATNPETKWIEEMDTVLKTEYSS